MQSVPGCSGGENDGSDSDYCVLPSAGEVNDNNGDDSNGEGVVIPAEFSGGPISTSGSFRLKKYWEPGYFWQEEPFEREWCAAYRYNGNRDDGYCWYGKERRRCRDEQIYIDKCRDSSRQQFRFLQYPNGEVQIRAADENRCLEMVGDEIYLRGCDENESNQRWFAPNGDFNGRRFELSQRSKVRVHKKGQIRFVVPLFAVIIDSHYFNNNNNRPTSARHKLTTPSRVKSLRCFRVKTLEARINRHRIGTDFRRTKPSI
jgi:hypothetical protein